MEVVLLCTNITLGFYRKSQKDIIPLYTNSSALADARRGTLEAGPVKQCGRRSKNAPSHGFNIISNQVDGNGSGIQPNRTRKYLADKKSDRLQREGHIALRDSMNRFYM